MVEPKTPIDYINLIIKFLKDYSSIKMVPWGFFFFFLPGD